MGTSPLRAADEPGEAATTLRTMILATGSGVGTALSLAAAGAYAVLAIGAHRLDPRTARWVRLLAGFLHAIVLGGTVVGGTPRFGFAPALSVTAWLVLTVYAVER